MMYQYETPEEDTRIVNGQGPWHARKIWCVEYCKDRWEYAGFGKFTFWSSEDYMLFLLRWS
jgi:hypothetical protein